MPVAGFHIMTKPIGPMCNLDCTYRFYLEKEKLYPNTKTLGNAARGPGAIHL